ncbi:3981_t:CDS:2, partial [Funneliformis caledonium]
MTEDILGDHMNTDVDIVNDDLISQEFNFLVTGPKSSNDPASDQEFNFFITSSKSSKGKQKQLSVNFDAPESGYEDKGAEIPFTNIDQGFFMRYLLLLVDRNIYSEFPKSLHMAQKLFGSFYNSNQHIELELLKIIQNHSRLDELSLFVNENQHLLECLPYIALKETVGSLTANEDFNLMKYSKFLTMSKNVKEKAGTESEPFSDALLKPMKSVKLSSEILALL